MVFTRCLFLLAGLGLLGAGPAHGQRLANWRAFRPEDGLRDPFVTTVSLGPHGRVWARHSEDGAASWLDGFGGGNFSAPGGGSYRIYENRSGQLWSVYADGLVEFKEGQWVKHPITEMAADSRTNLLRRLRQISLLPAERDHVFVLLSEQLLEFTAGQNRITPLRHASQTGLGRFYDLIPARDGGAWISAERGLAKLPSPVRKLDAQANWSVFPLPDEIAARNLQRPVEDDDGGITVVAETPAGEKRVVLRFDGQSWKQHVVAGEHVRAAWPALDQSFWMLTTSSLARLIDGQVVPIDREGILAAQFYDVAADTRGVFWLATSEGLLRYAPLLWRAPSQAPVFEGPVHAIREDKLGRLWFVGTEALVGLQGGQWSRYPLPPESEPPLPGPRRLFVLPSGELAHAGPERLLLFDPNTGRFESVKHPTGRAVKLLGQAQDGALYTEAPGEARADHEIEKFDGQNFEPVWQGIKAAQFGAELNFVVTTASGEVWLGGSGGLGRFREGKWQLFGGEDGFPAESALSLLELGDGKFWCGSRLRLLEFDGKKWTPGPAGLERVTQLVKSRDGSIWGVAGNGLNRFAQNSWVALGADEGLSDVAAYDFLEDRHGQAWAGTARGLRLYYPEADIDPPRLTITSPGQRVPPAPDGVVRVAFSGQDKWDATPPEQLLYSYRLDNDQWSAFQAHRQAAFTNLSAGPHRFAARVMDRNWNLDPDPATVEFSVVLPWSKDPRLLGMSLFGLVVALFFAGLAVNRHFRLVRSYAEVERQVAERTRELAEANQELLHSQKMTALGTFAAGIAHDFNNILSIVKGSAQIIESNLEDRDKIQTRVRRIKTVVEQGASVVKALLGYSRGTTAVPESCELAVVIDDALRLLGDHLPAGVTVRVEPGAAGLRARGPKELVQQILWNFILNATEAMEGRTGEVVVRAGRWARLPAHLVLVPATAPAYVHLSVQDHGGGITPEILRRIFEPFFTTKALSTRRGTGLGLSMVYEFAREMGAGLLVETTVGQGSTFTLILPASDAAAASPRAGAG